MSACTCEGGHPILCPVHAEEAMELMQRLSVAADSSRLTIPEEAARKIMLAMNPVIEYPGSSQIQRARRLRTHVETRGWEQTGKQFPEAVRMWAELVAGLEAAAPLIVAAERDRLLPELEFLFEHADVYNVPLALRSILAGTWDLAEAQEHVRRRAAELRGGVS